MSRELIPELSHFLRAYDISIVQTAIELREFVLNLIPDANELIYNSYNALAIAYSISDKQKDTFSHIAIYGGHVNLGFNRGAELKDPKRLLQGSGKSIRHFKVKSFNELQKTYITEILNEAYGLALQSLNDKKQPIKGISIVKSSSAKNKRPSK